MDNGFDIRFDPADGDPVSTVVDYIGDATTSLDMLEGARALLHRAANFVNVDDGYHVEAEACSLVYQLATGAADMMAASGAIPGVLTFDETYAGFVLAHVMKLVRKNPAPMWPGGAA